MVMSAGNVRGLLIRGLETEMPSLEDLGNFLRDLVFLHDHLVLGELYPHRATFRSYGFYSRNARPEIRHLAPKIKQLSMESPLGLLIALPAAVIASRGVSTMVDALVRLAEIGPRRAQIESGTELTRQRVETLRIRNQIFRGIAEQITADSGILGDQELRKLVVRDIRRLLESPIILGSVEEVDLPDDDDGTVQTGC